MCVTLYPSLSPAASSGPSSAAAGGVRAAGRKPGHETPHRGSHRAQSPLLASGATLHFPQTMDWKPGLGGLREESLIIIGNEYEVLQLIPHDTRIIKTYFMKDKSHNDRGIVTNPHAIPACCSLG